METRGQAARKRREAGNETIGSSSRRKIIQRNERIHMADTVRESPGSKQPSMDRQTGFLAMPDAAIHRVFDFLNVDMTGSSYRFSPGGHNPERTALSQTYHRLSQYYRHHYITKYGIDSKQLDFADLGLILAYFPRLTATGFCTLHGKPAESAIESYNRMTELSIELDHHGADLCFISQACLLLKRFTVWVETPPNPPVPSLSGEFSLNCLEELHIEHADFSASILVKIFAGMPCLRKLEINEIDRSFDPVVIRELPMSLEILSVASQDIRGDESLRILGRLPNLKEVDLGYKDTANWSMLLPGAARWEKLEIFALEVAGDPSIGVPEDQIVCDFLTRLTNLKCIKLIIFGGICASLMRALAQLPLLENLTLLDHGPWNLALFPAKENF